MATTERQIAAEPVVTANRIANASQMLENAGWRRSVAGDDDFAVGVEAFVKCAFLNPAKGILVTLQAMQGASIINAIKVERL